MLVKRKEDSEIVQFYENSSILICGGTGFLGRIFMSKLLRSCDTIRRIYLIIRSKKDTKAFVIFEELLKDTIFSDIPHTKNKVVCVTEDCCLLNLGLSEKDRLRVTSETTHAFHAAACVNFDENFGTAIAVTVVAVKEILNLCRDCERLKSFVYVSSTFAYCIRDVVGERMYDVPLRANDAIYLMQTLNSGKLQSLKVELIAPWPNTYNFSKALAEDIIKEEGLPTGIFRRSIGVGAGVLRALKVDTKLRADLVPIDMTANGLISSAWDVHNIYLKNENTKNCSTDKTPDSKIIE